MKEEQLNSENEKLSEEEIELKMMKDRIGRSLADQETHEKTEGDFAYTFEQIGLSSDRAKKLCGDIMGLLYADTQLPNIEAKVLSVFESTTIKIGDREINLVGALHEKLEERAEIVFSQVSPHLGEIKDKVIDYGAGDGQVTQLLHDRLGLNIEGVDVRLYKNPNITVPIKLFDGKHVDAPEGSYEAGLLTHVLHHETTNENILNELDRIIQKRLVILETIPVGETEEEMEKDKDRTFMNDYLYNRLFHNADVPVPGTFETPKKWVERFTQHGWRVVYGEDLGFDLPIIHDRHYLLALER